MFQKTKATILTSLVVLLAVGSLLSVPVYAIFCTDPGGDVGNRIEVDGNTCPAPLQPTTPPNNNNPAGDNSNAPGFDDTFVTPDLDDDDFEAEPTPLGCDDESIVGDSAVDEDNSNPIMCQFIRIVNFLSIGVTIVAAITVAIAGVQYASARGDPNKTSAAVNRLVQVGIAIAIYIFGWFLLNWLIPGGVIS